MSSGIPDDDKWVRLGAPSWYRKTGINLLDDAGVAAAPRRLGGTESRALADPGVLGLPFAGPYAYIRGPPPRCPVAVLPGDSDPQTRLPRLSGWPHLH
jgi:pyochelin biosynthesis protein PchC